MGGVVSEGSYILIFSANCIHVGVVSCTWERNSFVRGADVGAITHIS